MNWKFPVSPSVSQELIDAVGGNEIVSQTLARRGFLHPDQVRAFIDENYYQLGDPSVLGDVEKSVDRILSAIDSHEKIFIWGDFDVDGQTSTALLVSAIQSLGGDVDYYLPIREQESHGIHIPKLSKVLQQGAQLLVTCDTGISANDAVDYANQHDVNVIITDHHIIPAQLPQAFAIINPRFLPVNHPMGGLPGVGVAFQLAKALFQRCEKNDQIDAFLDLVALGIVSDLAILQEDVRCLLQRGIKVLRKTNRVGLRAVMELAEINPFEVTEEDIAYFIGPRLNSLGRLADANPAVELLTTKDINQARLIAQQIESFNARRKLVTNSVFQAVMAKLKENPSLLDKQILIIDHEDWPVGVIGIVASRLVERYSKPVILISISKESIGRGSARSVEGIDITSALECTKELLLTYGGHPMAAGFSLKMENLVEFRKSMEQVIRKLENPPDPILQIDGYLNLSGIDLELVRDLEKLAPFGPGNPPLTFVCRNLSLKNAAIVGRDEEHLVLTVEEEETGFESRVIWWHGSGWALPETNFDLAYHVRAVINRGLPSLQFEFVDSRGVEEVLPGIKPKSHKPEFVDYRNEPRPLVMLGYLRSEKDILVYGEGEAARKLITSGLPIRTRLELTPCENFVIWTIPPGPVELKQVLASTSSRKIYLFAQTPEEDDSEVFLRNLAGLIKFIISKAVGKVSLARLAARLGHRESTVKKGLIYLHALGHINFQENNQGEYLVSIDSKREPGDLVRVRQQLLDSLNETIAFRRFAINSSIDILLNN